MSDHSFRTTQLQVYLERMRAGDRAARDELFRRVCGRLEHLARKMLRAFPNVRRFAETDDVLQNALIRLLRSLETLHPDSTRSFFNLAAVHIRRELLDLARHFVPAQRLETLPTADDSRSSADEPADEVDAAEEMEKWWRFHHEVEHLPTEEREVVSLVFYHGWTQAEVAEMFQCSERTVRRRWDAALFKLHGLLREGSGDS